MTDQIVENEVGNEDESGVIRSLRDQVKALQSELKSRPGDVNIEAEVERRVARRDATRDALVNLGYSAKMTNLVLDNVEGDPTPEAVSSFLESVGLTAQSGKPGKPDPKPVGSVADLASRVAAAASTDPARDQVMEGLLQAKNARDIDAIMRQAGLAQ